jgi:DHA1 family bicyclomycin/chloramphenicol resistance-like MFS transporter
LKESHPRAARMPLALRPLLDSYAGFSRDRLFWPLLISSSVNFAGLFLYIASAPRIVLGLLHLSPAGFPWLFVPVVTGLIGGAWLSGRLAARRSAAFTINLGYVALLLACALHLLLAWWLPQARLPWSMLPLILQGMGVQLAFPTLTLLLLDRFPRQRGGASSVQAFFSLLLNALVAGVLSPLLSASMLQLGFGAAALTRGGFVSWRWYRGKTRWPLDQPLAGGEPGMDLHAQIAEPR